MKAPKHAWWIIAAALLVLCDAAVSAEDSQTPVTSASMVTLNFPENLEIEALVDYVAKRKGVNFLYDQELANQKITIKTPTEVPTDSLMTLLESALRMKGLTVTTTEVEGMLRIERGSQLTAVSKGPMTETAKDARKRPTLAVTRVFRLEHAGAARIESLVKPFLSASTANITSLPEHDAVIVTDYATNMDRIERLLAVADCPKREIHVRFIKIRNLEAGEVATKVTQLLQAKTKASGASQESRRAVTVVGEERTNQVAVVGVPDEVSETLALVESLDVPLGFETEIYTFEAAAAERVDRLVKAMIGEATAERLYESAIDYDANMLLVTTTPEIHQRLVELRQRLDQPVLSEQSPIRFYKLENAKAPDVLATLWNIEGQEGLREVRMDGLSPEGEGDSGLYLRGPTEAEVNDGDSTGRKDGATAGGSGSETAVGGARVLADEPTNTIIVIAKPSLHAMYRRLIERLDVRRPQVLIEATVVTVDTTDEFELGVEIRSSESVDGGQLLNFTQFGLTATDEETGLLSLVPGVGYTGALLDADIAQAVIHALESDARVKVVSRPSLLINDNATGTLASEDEEPYESVNAGSTVATTSFAGYSAAGTKVEITPQISQGDHLKIEFEITLSSFGEDSSDSLPPSRQTNRLASEATIPDGHTIVVGGLTREDVNDTTDRVPLLGRVPVVEYLFSHLDNTSRKKTMYVFIRAVILRDDKFESLKALSDEPAVQAGIAGEYPLSEPVEIR